MCACEWNYVCIDCRGITERDDVFADFAPEPLTPEQFERLAYPDSGGGAAEWKTP